MKPLLALLLVAGLIAGHHHAQSLKVRFSRDGGIAGQQHKLSIDAKGHAVVSDRVGGKPNRRTFTLTHKQRTKLRHALAAARGASSPMPTGGCADCFVYTIKADGLSVTYDEATQPSAPVQRLAALLGRIGG